MLLPQLCENLIYQAISCTGIGKSDQQINHKTIPKAKALLIKVLMFWYWYTWSIL